MAEYGQSRRISRVESGYSPRLELRKWRQILFCLLPKRECKLGPRVSSSRPAPFSGDFPENPVTIALPDTALLRWILPSRFARHCPNSDRVRATALTDSNFWSPFVAGGETERQAALGLPSPASLGGIHTGKGGDVMNFGRGKGVALLLEKPATSISPRLVEFSYARADTTLSQNICSFR